ncbi:NADH-quinone oxidoreductase subunit J family protein [Persicitalea jodogahamensis]|uniref:NADH-quinone oxidoreductase subunit J n=1 Tax=Persicitalea jodogahamensis TaxID=402147 RepID=A0A8J3GC29_9BACT|nr:NADH-quinone oxidoreductase subunit J [Persicitalea jodogahamensis]GHB85652.1 NADH-quinone oxidoreductase subunit J [Persicitalea jodogahamensis]
MSTELLAFYAFAALALGSGLFILLTRNLMYAAFSLFLALLGIAALFVLAGADFLAVAQLMVYVGGILVLLIFGIMLTRVPDPEATSQTPNRVLVGLGRKFWGLTVGLGLFVVLFLVVVQANFALDGDTLDSRSTIRTLGVELMTTHLLPFEIAGILLLVALVGAAYLAMHRNPDPTE